MNTQPIRKEEVKKKAEVIDVDFQTGKKKSKGKDIKYRKDGKPKQTRSNSKARKGMSQKVFPIKDKEMIKDITQWLRDKRDDANTWYNKQVWGRYLLMWVIGINIGLRFSDLRELRWSQIFYKNGTIQKGVPIIEDKSDKQKTFFFNQYAVGAINEYVEMFKPDITSDNYVFISREKKNGKPKPISTTRVIDVLEEACKACGFQKNVGTHTMRKSFGYAWFTQHSNNADALARLQRLFNHSSSKVTLGYIGIEDEENEQYYNDLSWD